MKITVKDIIFIILVIIGCILLFRACKACDGMGGKPTHTDTVKVVTDTVYSYNVTDTVYVPQITKITNTVYKPFTVHDTLETYEVRIDPVDTAKILARYYQKVNYSDTQKIEFGSVIINDTVTQNRIVSRGFKTNLSVPTITKTITLRTPERTQIWIGANGMTDLKQLYVGAELMLKTKGNIAYSGGVMVGQNGGQYYTGGVKVLLRFKKR